MGWVERDLQYHPGAKIFGGCAWNCKAGRGWMWFKFLNKGRDTYWGNSAFSGHLSETGGPFKKDKVLPLE